MSDFETSLSRWEEGDERSLADCHIFQVTLQKYYHPGRKVEAEFSILHSPDWIQAIPLTADKKVVMVNQYRFGSNTFSWEMPGGLLDEGEDPITGALRELKEETGYTGHNPRIIGTVSPNPAIQRNTQTFVFLENCEETAAQSWDTHEDLEVGIFSLNEIHQMIIKGHVHNSIAVNALFFLERELNQ